MNISKKKKNQNKFWNLKNEVRNLSLDAHKHFYVSSDGFFFQAMIIQVLL